jgi:hypothetical protein
MRIVPIAAALFVVLTGGSALAQQDNPASPGERVPEGQKAPPEIVPPDSKNKNLSDRLSKDKGVITPPPSGAPDMNVKPPVPHPNTTPVIPPPGSPGGDQRIVPK